MLKINRKNRLVSILLSVVMLMGILTVMPLTVSASGSNVTIGNLIYEIKGSGTSQYAVVKGRSTTSYVSVVIPATISYNGSNIKVTEIADNAFSGNNITSVEIGINTTKIGMMAFSNTSLTSMKFLSATPPTFMEQMGIGVFWPSSSSPTTITKISVPCGKIASYQAVSQIRSSSVFTFCGCNDLATVTVTTNVVASAFENCTKLTTLIIGSNVISLGTSAFKNCKSLSTVTIGSGVNSIGASAFAGCTALKKIEFKRATLAGTLGASIFPTSGIINVVVPCGQNTIAEYKNLSQLTAVRFNVLCYANRNSVYTNSTTNPSPYQCKSCPNRKGDVDSNNSITIMDSVEILQYLANLNNKIDNNPVALNASLITAASISNGAPTSNKADALEIQNYLAKLPSLITG